MDLRLKANIFYESKTNFAIVIFCCSLYSIFYPPTPTNLNYLNSSITQAMYLHTDTVCIATPPIT